MKSKILFMLLLVLFLYGCGNPCEEEDSDSVKKIKEWQSREQIVQQDIPEYDADLLTITDTGLTAHNIISARPPVVLKNEPVDYWETSDEVKETMVSDCEGTCVYWYSIFREEQVFSDHAMFFRWVQTHQGKGHMILVIKCYEEKEDDEIFYSEIYIDNGKMKWVVDYPVTFHEFDLWSIWK